MSNPTPLDREMFEFEKRKFEDEERCREFEMSKWEAEREDANRKWEAEVRLREAEIGLKRDQAAKQETNVGKNKVFSDAMRSFAIRMSNDPIEAVAFFMNVEQLFDVFTVPTDLKAFIIRPYLNDKAKSIVSKLTPDIAGNY